MMCKIQMEGIRIDEMEESPYFTGLDTITRERYKQKIITYAGRDPWSDFSTKLKYLPAIEVVDIDKETNPDCRFRQAILKVNPAFIWGTCVTLETLLQSVACTGYVAVDPVSSM